MARDLSVPNFPAYEMELRDYFAGLHLQRHSRVRSVSSVCHHSRLRLDGIFSRRRMVVAVRLLQIGDDDG